MGAGGYVSSPTATGLVHGKIVFDSANNAYFCDLTGSKLYRVTSAGVASAIPNLACTDVAIDAQSNTLYIADYIGGAISKVGLNGNAWPLTPIPIISGLGMYNPVGVSIDPANPSRYLYYAAQGEFSYYKLDLTTGVKTRIAGTGAVGAGAVEGNVATATALKGVLEGVTADAFGNVYLFMANQTNQIWKLDSAGILHHVAGVGTAGTAGDGGPARNAYLDFPDFGVIDKNGNLIFSDRNNTALRKIDLSTGIITTLTGGLGENSVSPNGTDYAVTKLGDMYGMGIDNEGYYWASTSTGVVRFSPKAPLTITKTADKSQVNLGDPLTYTVTITNTSAHFISASNVTLQDVVPSNLIGVTWTCTAQGATPCSSATISPPNVSIPSLAPKAALTFSITGTVGAGTALFNNTATLTPGTGVCQAAPANPTCSAVVSVKTLQAKIDVSKTVLPAGATMVVPNSTVSYEMTVGNSGDKAGVNVLVTDNPPADLSNVSWTCAPAAACPNASGSGAINETIPSLPVGVVLTYTLTGKLSATPAASIVNTLSVNPGPGNVCGSGNPAPCIATASLSPVGMVSITKTSATMQPVKPGDVVTYTVEVLNTGVVPATNVAVSDALPAGLSGGSWVCAGACGAPSGGLPLGDTVASIPVGGKATYTVTATANPASSLPAQISNIATAQPGNGGVCSGGVAPPCNTSPVLLSTNSMFLSINVNVANISGFTGLFSYSVSCTSGANFVGMVNLPGSLSGATTVGPLQPGDVCTVSPLSRPVPPSGYYWAANPTPQVITLGAALAAVSFANPLKAGVPTIPTLNEWMLVILGLFILGHPLVTVFKKRRG